MSDSNHTRPGHISKGINRVIYFFPLQLLIIHIKRNLLLLLVWLILYLYVTNSIGTTFGISYLFLSPEYMGKVNFLSYLILGFSLGGFIMAFNIYSYIMYAVEFPFLATLSRPFLKFCFNNHIIPLFFSFTLFLKAYFFQVDEEFKDPFEALLNVFGIIIGISIFIVIAVIYFIRFNKDIYKLSGKDQSHFEKLQEAFKESSFIKPEKWYKRIGKRPHWRIDTYMSGLFKISLARSIKHYDKELLQKVFTQNHINASIFELVLVISFLTLGMFRHVEFFNIPAAASVFLLFTILILFFSAIYSWFKGWTLPLMVVLGLSFNYITNHTETFRFKNFAYGIDYEKTSEYTYKNISKLNSDLDSYLYSRRKTISILENWKTKNTKVNYKPKMVFLNVSGGGLRAALWSMIIISKLDSATNGKLLKQTQLITGASGGMIGASYLRELYYQKMFEKKEDIRLTDPKYYDNICKDLLNPVAFSIATSDMFIRFKKTKVGPYTYTVDRGYFFEEKLAENINALKDRKLYEYYLPEFQSDIPMMIYSPAVVNDGRRMLISPQKIAYLTHNDSSYWKDEYPAQENVEFTEMFKDNNPLNLKVTSAVRMNATFPYILPMVSLPTNPPIELMDAGLRDNYGLKTSIDFIREFKDWIEENTSGIVLVNIRDKQKFFNVENPNSGSVVQRLFAPFTNIYDNVLRTHDYNNDERLKDLKEFYSGDIQFFDFYMDQSKKEDISMSFHLTEDDKQKIFKALNSDDNQKYFKQIVELLK